MHIIKLSQHIFKLIIDKLFWKTPFLVIGFLFLISSTKAQSATYYISPTGDDINNPGTIDLPFQTITRAIQIIVAGDTIFIRGGTHTYSATINISKSGTITNRCYLLAYPGERPLLDFSSQGLGLRGIKLSANYWYIRGLDIKGAGDNGMNISKSNNIIEFCSFYENRDSGLQLGGGASNNQIINCDSYFNADPGQGNADGFSPKLDVGTGNYFFGCRSWQNSDDGYDGYLRPSNNITTTYENCWAFMNGYLKNGNISGGNGNGFKMGGSDSKTLMHNAILINCIAFDNLVKGFDENNNRGSMTLYNCTGFRNNRNFSLPGPIYTDSGKVITIANCLSYVGINSNSIMSTATQYTNSWQGFTVTSTDFINLDTTGVRGPRKVDGSLPDLTFLHLATGSSLIDAGTNVGLPYNGIAPDLGAFETNAADGIHDELTKSDQFILFQNYPNPFNPTTEIQYILRDQRFVTIEVFNIIGQNVATLVDELKAAGNYKVQFIASELPSGVYTYRLNAVKLSNLNESSTSIKKMVLLK
jgi:hypothetical protein